MRYKFSFAAILALGYSSHALAQTPVSASELVQRVLARSPRVASARASLLQSQSLQRSAGAPANLQFELAPGVGFTNSNALLTQEFDVFGVRAASAHVGRAKSSAAEAEVRIVTNAVAFETLTAVAALLSAKDSRVNLQSLAEAAAALTEVVRKRVEIGEAAQVHLTRVELEQIRIEQLLADAQAQVLDAHLALGSLTGEPVRSSAVPEVSWVEVGATSLPQAPAVALAQAELRVAEAELEAARKLGRPRLSAGVAADIWSVDRSMVRGNNFGLQLSFAAPLFDRGENRHAVKAAEAARERQRIHFLDAERSALAEIERARALLMAAKQIRRTYEKIALPKAESMTVAIRKGYESGLVTLLEVLESQQTYRQLLREKIAADQAVRLAELRVMKATGNFPGMEVGK